MSVPKLLHQLSRDSHAGNADNIGEKGVQSWYPVMVSTPLNPNANFGK